MQPMLDITIMSPEEVVWEGRAEALSSENGEGSFDILPGHARFMTLLSDANVVIHLGETNERVFTFNQAVLFFENNNAKIYIHSAQDVVLEEVVQ